MKKVFKLAIVLSLFLVIMACGHKQSPTGGKADIEKIKILAVTPDEFSDLKDRQIDITFSKTLDRTTVPTGIYIYPPIDKKRFKYQGNHLLLRILEPLKLNTNYYFTFSPRIKDERGNTLADNQTIVYANGKLQNNKISGEIKLEEPNDAKLPLNLSLLDSDSLLIFTKVIHGSTYSLDNLNPESYILRAYIDKNVNGKYDLGIDPYSEAVSPKSPISTIDLNLVYFDTTKVVLKSAVAASNREFDVTLSKSATSIGAVKVKAAKDNSDLPVELIKQNAASLVILTAAQDTTKYDISVSDIADRKNNKTKESHIYIKGVSQPDKTPPAIISTMPRNGTSINELQPEMKVFFSEIIPINNIKYTFIDTETNERIDVRVLSGNDRVYIFKPSKMLQNYHSYKLTISRITSDISGNVMGKDYEILFLTLLQNGG